MNNETPTSDSISSDSTDTTEQIIEGFEEDSDLGDFPIDTLLIRNEQRTVFDVVRRIDQGGYIMNPDFQRDFVWDRDKQSRLIESVLMRIPLPVFYLAENDEGKVIVVDGLQRLTTFKQFLNNEFVLKLPDQEILHGKKFDDLSPKLKNRIEDSNLILYILDNNVPENAKLQIFERVNAGEPLTRQQMRNCLYNGKATEWLKHQAETDLFLEATGKSLKAKTMRDREFVNRFCSFWLLGRYKYEKGDMDLFLAKSLIQMNKMSEMELDALAGAFHRTLRNNLILFGKHAFRKHQDGASSRSILNASLWDVMTIMLGRYSEEHVHESPDLFRSVFYELIQNTEFNDAITYSVNGTNKVTRRFVMATQKFKEVIGDYTALA